MRLFVYRKGSLISLAACMLAHNNVKSLEFFDDTGHEFEGPQGILKTDVCDAIDDRVALHGNYMPVIEEDRKQIQLVLVDLRHPIDQIKDLAGSFHSVVVIDPWNYYGRREGKFFDSHDMIPHNVLICKPVDQDSRAENSAIGIVARRMGLKIDEISLGFRLMAIMSTQDQTYRHSLDEAAAFTMAFKIRINEIEECTSVKPDDFNSVYRDFTTDYERYSQLGVHLVRYERHRVRSTVDYASQRPDEILLGDIKVRLFNLPIDLIGMVEQKVLENVKAIGFYQEARGRRWYVVRTIHDYLDVGEQARKQGGWGNRKFGYFYNLS